MEGVYDVAVVGGGIMGLCTAYELSKRGKSVILIEQFDLLHHRGSSHGESRTFRVTYPEDYYTLMAKKSLELWQKAEEEAGFRVFIKTGQLDLGRETDPGLQQVISSCRKHGVSHQVLDTHELHREFNMLELPEDHIAVRSQEAGVLRATKSCAMFLGLALKHGVVLQDNAKVVNLSRNWKTPADEPALLVSTTRGSVLAKKCVLACGAWTSKLVEKCFGQTLPVQPLHTYIAYWQVEDESKDEFLAENGFPTFAYYDKKYFYGTPSLEYPGLLKASIHGGTPCDADDRVLAPDVEKLKTILGPWIESTFKGKVKHHAPAIVEACMYSMTPDQDFILDVVPQTGGQVMVAAGFSGHGFKMAPVVGKIMADLAVDGVSQEPSMDMFSLQRFVSNPLGNEKGFDTVHELSALNLNE